MSIAESAQPVLLELGQEQWKAFLDSVETWLGNVLLTQASFRKLAEDTADKINDPRIKEQIVCIADTAKEHEQQARELYRIIGREPSEARAAMGAAAGLGREVLGNIVGLAGGAHGGWHDLRQMLLSNLDSMGAFAAVQQVGYALGFPELAEAAFKVVRDKSTQQLLIQEYMLEMAPLSILYDQPI